MLVALVRSSTVLTLFRARRLRARYSFATNYCLNMPSTPLPMLLLFLFRSMPGSEARRSTSSEDAHGVSHQRGPKMVA